MNVIYVIDPIGIHSGMRYYYNAYRQIFSNDSHVFIKPLSNYGDNKDVAFLPNFYEGNLIQKLIKLIYSGFKLYRITSRCKNALFIHLTYGTLIDFFLLKCTAKANNRIIDVHEVVQQGSESSSLFLKLFKSVYKDCAQVIIHSAHGKEMLNMVDYKGASFEIPHFRYCEDSIYNKDNIKEDVLSAFSKKETVLLFFGNITYNKGIDILIDFYRKLGADVKKRLHLIIAGKSIDGQLEELSINQNEGISVINRHINDDEMKFIFINSSYVILPYRITYQSGVLEMAFNFRKPVIVSDIPYFKKIISLYPSFGVVLDFNSNMAEVAFLEIINDSCVPFFNSRDLDRYYDQEIVDAFHTWIIEKISNSSSISN